MLWFLYIRFTDVIPRNIDIVFIKLTKSEARLKYVDESLVNLVLRKVDISEFVSRLVFA